MNTAPIMNTALSGLEAVREIRSGLPIDRVDEAIRDGLVTAVEIDQLAVPRKTLAHRRQIGRLSVEQSDRFARLLRIIATAEDVFANREKAATWLRRASFVLDGQAPLHLLDTDAGARAVEALLTQIAHGIAA
jgi:putative toxin-antitoxin system antitoxin component (TIGR02293 family)